MRNNLVRSLTSITCVALICTLAPLQARATWHTVTLYGFQGTPDGALPMAGLIAAPDGSLYGTTSGGGANGDGAVFQLSPPTAPGQPWVETILYSFQGAPDGSSPVASLLLGRDGALYGTTLNGGTARVGTVFKLAPPASPGGSWTYALLYAFQGDTDGSYPRSAVIPGANGVLYGTTTAGGTGAAGTIFKLEPPATAGGSWTHSVLYSFQGGPNVAPPYAKLTRGANGVLYGTTRLGGAAGFGTVFQLTPPTKAATAWTYVVVSSLPGGTDARGPVAPVTVGANGAVYGTTPESLFQLTPPTASGSDWTRTTLYSFPLSGGDASGNVEFCGNSGGELFGATALGGTDGRGTFFKLSAPSNGGDQWMETVLYSFGQTPEDAAPIGGLLFGPHGSMYGITPDGGAAGLGSVIQLVP